VNKRIRKKKADQRWARMVKAGHWWPKSIIRQAEAIKIVKFNIIGIIEKLFKH